MLNFSTPAGINVTSLSVSFTPVDDEDTITVGGIVILACEQPGRCMPSIYHFFAMLSFINSIIQEHKC